MSISTSRNRLIAPALVAVLPGRLKSLLRFRDVLILVLQLLKAKNIKQREMTAILGIKQTDVSHIMNGHFSRFSQERLIGFLNKLEQKVTIQVIRHCRGEPINKLVLG